MAKNLIDTNLIIRFLVNDDPQKASKVEKLLKGKPHSNTLLDTVVAEIIWVLLSYYEVDKKSVIEQIRSLIHVDSIECNQMILDLSLTIWEKHNISFIDAYLAAHAQAKNLNLYSYDLKFNQIPKIIRKEP